MYEERQSTFRTMHPSPQNPPPNDARRFHRTTIALALTLLATVPWLVASGRYALRSAHDCDIWRQWAVTRYLAAHVNPYALGRAILERNYGPMTGESRRHLHDLVIYEIHPSLDAAGLPGYLPKYGPPTATYPPSSLLLIALTGGWLPRNSLHIVWLSLNAIFLALVTVQARRLHTPRGWGPGESLLAWTAVALLWPPVHEALRTLQFIIPVTWFIGQLALRGDRSTLRTALLLTFALIKPSAALPFILLPLLRGRWQPVALAGAFHLAATALVGWWVHTPPADLLRDWLRIPGYMLQGAYTIQEVINRLGVDNSPVGIAMSLGFAGSCALWAALHRRARAVDLAGFLAVASVLWTYHERYDFVLLLIPLLAALRRLADGPCRRRDLAIVAALVLIALALTDLAYQHDHPALHLVRWGGRLGLTILLAGTAALVREAHQREAAAA